MSEQKNEWDEFLLEWPKEKLKAMTLEQYSNIGDKNTFTYWLELFWSNGTGHFDKR